MAQAKLSEEATPAADDGWIEWAGGVCPVDASAKVHIRLRDGTESETTTERILPIGTPMTAGLLFWQHGGEFDPATDIIAYRVLP